MHVGSAGVTHGLPCEKTVALSHREVRGPGLSDVRAQRGAVGSRGGRDPLLKQLCG